MNLPKRQFYDYKAKYTKSAKTKHIMPARLSKSKYLEVLKIAKKAHDAFKCRGVTRADFKFYKGNFYLLEINTQPGMTSLSLVPEIANFRGIKFEQLVEKIYWMQVSIKKITHFRIVLFFIFNFHSQNKFTFNKFKIKKSK